MEQFTPSQLDVLSEIAGNRLTVVRAGPGAGKTRVFVEALKREIASCASSRFGVAALSFTNVAREEIANRMKGPVLAPHFVGTLDAFFWRFVVRPFAALAGVTPSGARLLPSPLDELQYGPDVQYGPDHWQQTTVFRVRCAGGDENTPDLLARGGRVSPQFLGSVLAAKRAEWAKNGRVTHSDVQYLASCILRGPHANWVRELVARRFPVVLVDEFQDTGPFLGRALLALLDTPHVRGALVGDPDQAIFQFGGARRDLFDRAEKLAGSKSVTLDESHRCPRRIAAVASALSRTGKRVITAPDAHEGRAVLFVHSQSTDDARFVLLSVEAALSGRTPVILSRKSATVRRLAASTAGIECPSGCKFAAAMWRAAELARDGDASSAARIAGKELAGVLLGTDDFDADDLRRLGIPHLAWKRACHQLLFEAAQRPPTETWNQWVERLRVKVAAVAMELHLSPQKFGSKIRTLGTPGEKPMPGRRPAVAGPIAEVMTVHQAKGREFPAVIFYVPKPHKTQSPCPSLEWWSNEANSEEREVAFVACSRSKELLILAVHRKTFDALSDSQPQFVALFETVHEPASSSPNKKRAITQPA